MFRQLTTVLLNQPQIREQWEKMTDYDHANLNNNERVTSLVFGGSSLLGGLSKPLSLRGIFGLTSGAYLLYRGLKGYCPLYDAFGYSSLTSADEKQLEIERREAEAREQSYSNGSNGYANRNSVDEQLLETFPASDAPANY
ncbi:MAG: DUF2892 domain-containing protein [Anaerolineae bacterium]|nr:DUF2892 domain-containing protein [Anaerolineae bacterium]